MVAIRFPVQERIERLVIQSEINLKLKDKAALSTVKPSLLKHFQIKLMVA
jgi:hypothetical protein